MIYNSIQENPAIYDGDDLSAQAGLNADMSHFDFTQYDTELAEV